MSYTVAVGGATGNVGKTMVAILEQRNFPIAKLEVLASAESAQRGRKLTFRGEELPVSELSKFDFSKTDFLFLSTGGENSRIISPIAAANGCIVIDNSSAFRMQDECALIVPEINGQELSGSWQKKSRIFPVANCSTIQLVMALKPLHDFAKIQRIVVSTYQSCSGGGKKLTGRLQQESTIDVNQRQILQQQSDTSFAHGHDKPVAFNVVPQIDVFTEGGKTKEEWKIEVETKKILNDERIQISATCVRVPSFVGHAEAVNIQFERPIPAQVARDLLSAFPGIVVMDEQRLGGYATPLDVEGRDEVFVSRIREDKSAPNCLSIWVVADNVRKGAALNAVQIAETLVKHGLRPRTI